MDVVRHGQGVLNVLPLSGVKDEVDKQIISLDFPSKKRDEDEDGGNRRAV